MEDFGNDKMVIENEYLRIIFSLENGLYKGTP